MKYIIAILTFCVFVSAAQVSMTGEPPLERTVVQNGMTLRDFITPGQSFSQTDIDPGVAPEGDYLGFAAFTNDGNRVLITNRGTNNVTVFNWATMGVLANVNVGSYPGGIACSDSFAVLTLGFVDSVVIMRLSDYSIAATLPADSQPWVVRISPDQHYAYVGNDLSNTCDVYDLHTLTRSGTIANFPLFLSLYSWNSENGRNCFAFSDFKVTPDGSHLMIPDGRDSLFFFDVATGACDDTITGIGSNRFVEFSGDGTKAIIANDANPCIVRQIDMATHEITAEVTITGHALMTYDAGVNQDGSKAFIGIDNNVSALVRFESSDFITFSSTYTAFWIGVSPDHARAISGQYNFSIIDFATEQMVGQHSGNAQAYGAVSLVGNRALGYDPNRHEGLYFYDYTTPGPGMYRGTTISGLPPEGDCPHRVAITPDGTKLLSDNVLSDNVTIIDLATNTIDTILPVGDRPQEIAVTSDSRWAVATAGGADQVVIIDLSDNSIAATLTVGSGPFTVSISRDDSFAYVGSIGANTVSKIRLAGASSYVEAEIPVGEIGIVWAAYGVPSGVRVSPNGLYVLVAVSFSDEVQVINTLSNSVVTTLPVGDFPLDFAFDSTGDAATVTNYMAGTYSTIHVLGETSSVVATNSSQGQYPMRLAFNPVLNQISIGDYSGLKVIDVDPHTGDLINTHSYSGYGPLTDIKFDRSGQPIVLTGAVGSYAGHLHHGADHFPLVAAPAQFDYCPAVSKAAVALSGPDWVSVFDWSGASQAEAVNVPVTSALKLSVTAVSTREATIHYSLPGMSTGALSIYDNLGRRVRAFRIPHAGGPVFHSLTWDLCNAVGARVSAGTYFCRLQAGPAVGTARTVVTP